MITLYRHYDIEGEEDNNREDFMEYLKEVEGVL